MQCKLVSSYSITGLILPGGKNTQLAWNTKNSFIASWHFVDDFNFFLYYWHKLVLHGGKNEPVSFVWMQAIASLAKAISFSVKSCCQVKQNVFLWTDKVCGTGGYPITVSGSEEELQQQRGAAAEVSHLKGGWAAPAGCEGSLAVLLWGWQPITAGIKVASVLCVNRAANRIVLKLEVQLKDCLQLCYLMMFISLGVIAME